MRFPMYVCLAAGLVLSSPSDAIHFNCSTVLLVHAGLGAQNNTVPVTTYSFEAALGVAFHALEQASPPAMRNFRGLAFDTLKDVDIVSTKDGLLSTPYRYFFPNRTAYAEAPRIRQWKAPLIVWPETFNSPNEAALAAVRLIYEIKALEKLPPNTVRAWRQLNGSKAHFLSNAVNSLQTQYLVYSGLRKMGSQTKLPARLGFFSRWSALFRERATRNPYFAGLRLTEDLVGELDIALAGSDSVQTMHAALTHHVESNYSLVLGVDRGVSGTLTAVAILGMAYGGYLLTDVDFSALVPDQIEIRVRMIQDRRD